MAKSLTSIAAVERDTGLSKDTLRVWERRYGFPTPLRDGNGERVYPRDQVEKLRVIRRLMDSGIRPSKIVAEPLSKLNAQLASRLVADQQPPGECLAFEAVLRVLKAHQATKLYQQLAHELGRRGPKGFVLDIVAPLNTFIGAAWAAGRIEIFEEHLYTEQVRILLRQSLGTLMPDARMPCVVLTTLPGEQHELGILMAQACLAVDGAHCISLGVQTPIPDIVKAAHAHHADVIGISCSEAMRINRVREGLADLRMNLECEIEIWAGGSLWRRAKNAVPGVKPMVSLTDIPSALDAWREKRVFREHQGNPSG